MNKSPSWRWFQAALGFVVLTTPLVSAQTSTVPIPKTPVPKMDERLSRNGFDSADIGASIKPSKPTVQQVIYITLGESRPWTSVEGKILEGKLIAFEQPTETPTSGTPQALDASQITVVKDGKARLLVKNQPIVLPLERLAESDRALIEKIRAGIAAQAKAASEKKP
jgi:hypothetical protein